MRMVETIESVRRAVQSASKPLGLVPTMGYLHEGHLSLIRTARAECDAVVVSIFVNPTQFGPGEDFERYPRDLNRDLSLCEREGVDVVFTPNAREMYPQGFRTYVDVTELQDRWEGASRPGHFRGVATVVTKLFRIVQPQRAYFGEKDYQQLKLVQRMAADLVLDVEVIGCPIIREPDGLAMSSRNVYLDDESRRRAAALFAALADAQRDLACGVRSAARLCTDMRAALDRVGGIAIDYVAVVDPESLEPVDVVANEARALIAAWVGGVRLIDNAPLVPPA
ncbi:MAG TPA: pantoate--beta-alanine ligase [Chloroflexota bacterium]|nr:pantoate--beta-alanine ligase [Chloroflexota bacterium]